MKKAYFFIDDTIWVLRDITRQRPASLFDNAFMKLLKEAHEKYGLKTQLNLFYRTDSFYGYDQFSLADMTDAYKPEFEANSDWLKMAFHAFEEFPDYPHVNATYEDTFWLFKNIEKEVFRFAGKASFAYAVCPHWLPVSREGVRALHDCGVKLLDVTSGDAMEYNDDPTSLPYGHSFRLLQNRQPETRCFTRGSRNEAINRSICAYNHLDTKTDEEIFGTLKTVYNEEIGIHFKRFFNSCLNLTPCDELADELAPFLKNEYIGIGDHEQYFYSDYMAYQPDYADRINKMCEILTTAGFSFICGEDILK